MEIFLGKDISGEPCTLLSQMANRHGLIAGATGTGKTVTLQVLAESFSRLGVPVFTADVKGDLAGLALPGSSSPKLQERLARLEIKNHQLQPFPVLYWDLLGKLGHPVRSTISEMGPLLLSRLFDLNDTQESVLEMAFRVADDQGLLLLDIKDLRAALAWIGENSSELRSTYGNVSPATIGAIQRRLLNLEDAGGKLFFGEPALRLADFLKTDFSGNGVISILDASQIISDPRLYATFLLWLMSELFEQLDEIGDQEKPRLVFFFDEAHLLFRETPKALLEKIETLTRLIRSKGVGVFYITQNPADIPETILGQLGNRFQHALRAYTPSAQGEIKAASDAFRSNPAFKTIDVLTTLEVGEALISTLDEKGTPRMAQRVLIAPPSSRIGPVTEAERRTVIERSPLKGTYETASDRESAYEILKKRVETSQQETAAVAAQAARASSPQRQSATEAFFKSLLRSVGSQVGRQIARGIIGSILGGRR